MKLKLSLPSLKGLKTKGSGRRWMKSLRSFVLWSLVTTLVFVLGVWMSLPTQTIAWRVSHELQKKGHQVSIGDVSVMPWGTLKLRDVEWHFKSKRPEQANVPMVFEQISAGGSIPLISALSYLFFDNIDVSLDGEMDEGRLEGRLEKNDKLSRVHVALEELPLYSVPKVQASLNAPLRGTFELFVDLEAPENKYEKASGQIRVVCTDCKIGDGETLLFVPGVTKGMLAKGITIPEIDLGSLNGVLEVKDGKATTEEFETAGQGVSFKISGGIELQDPIENSRFDLVLKVKISEALQEEHDNIRLMVSTAHKDSKLKGADDGWLGFKLKGNLGKPKFTPFHALSKEMRLRQARERRRQRNEKMRKRREERKRKAEERKKQKEAEKAKKAEDDQAQKEADKEAEEEAEREREEREREEKTRRENEEAAAASADEHARAEVPIFQPGRTTRPPDEGEEENPSENAGQQVSGQDEEANPEIQEGNNDESPSPSPETGSENERG